MRYIYLPLMLIGALPALLVLAVVEWGSEKLFGTGRIPGSAVGAVSIVFGTFICIFLTSIIL